MTSKIKAATIELTTGWVTYAIPGQAIRAYVAHPAGRGPWPALINVHGAAGLDKFHERLTERYAREGYLVIAPDIYTNDDGYHSFAHLELIERGMQYSKHRPNPAPFLEQYPEETWAEIERASDWVENRPDKTYIDVVRGGYDYLLTRADIEAIGCIGFCMGGRLTGELAATGADLAAGVIYYGINPRHELIANIRCPLQGHYADSDHRITDAVPAFDEAMKAAGKPFAYFVYEARHGFHARHGLASYNAEAVRVSESRALPFLARTLKTTAMVGQ